MNKSNWKRSKLNEIGFVGRGKSKHRPRNDPTLYTGHIPFIQTADVKNANLYIRNFSQTYNRKGLAQSKLWRSGTLCITIAANIAETAILGIDACFPDSIVGFIPDNNLCDVRYVKYYLDSIKLQMQNISKGTTQDNLPLEKLLSFDIYLPPLEIQKEVGSILSAYDDLIEINNRRIQILQEMAQAIYREWFVHFRFPGHEQVRMVESELGLIPKNWKIGRLDDTLILQRGFDLPLSKRRTGEVPVIAANGIIGFHSEAKVKGPGVITGRSGSLGKIMFSNENFWPLNTTLWVKEYRSVSPYYAYYLLSLLGLDQYNSGVAVPTLNRNDVHGIKVVIPSVDIVSLFSQKIRSLFELQKTLQRINDNLYMQRDYLATYFFQ